MSDRIQKFLQLAKEKGIKTVLAVKVNQSFASIQSVVGNDYSSNHKQKVSEWFDWLRIQLPELDRQEHINRCACLLNDAKVICLSSSGYTPAIVSRIINNL